MKHKTIPKYYFRVPRRKGHDVNFKIIAEETTTDKPIHFKKKVVLSETATKVINFGSNVV
jgi:hypothetical protein